MRALSYIGAEKITFPPRPDGQTDIQTDRRTEISVYKSSFATKNYLYKYWTLQQSHFKNLKNYLYKVKIGKKKNLGNEIK